MICVYAKRDTEFNDDGVKWILNKPRDIEHIKVNEIHVTTHTFAVHKQDAVQAINLIDGFPLPPLLSRDFIENPPSKKKIRMMAHNGIGGGIGDAIASLDAYRRLYHEFWKRGRHLEIDILCQDGKWLPSNHVFMFEPYINGTVVGTMRLDHYCQYDVRMDTEGYVERLDSTGMNLYDFACSEALVDTDGPHRPEWHIAQPAWDEVAEALEGIPKPRMILNFFASSFRRIPKTHRRKLVEGYVKKGYEVLLVASERNAEEVKWAAKIDMKYRKHVHDMCGLTSRSLHHLAAMAGQVDLVCTPDTGLMHMCGVTGVPTVAVFYSIEPHLRIRDFSNIAPFCPKEFREGPHWGLHKPQIEGLNLNSKAEFERIIKKYENPNAVDKYLDTWKKVSVDAILAVEPGERVESRLGTAPMRLEDVNAEADAFAAPVPEQRSEELPKEEFEVSQKAD